MKPVLEIRSLVVNRYDGFSLAIDHLAVTSGEALVIIGPNGAGKSTFLLVLAQLLKPADGQILFHGRQLGWRNTLAYRRRIALVLQDPLLLNTSVANNVASGLRFRRLARKEVSSRVEHWLEKFGVSHLHKRNARQLSGGEAQRVSLARAFALQPDILLLDEPFSALDAPTRTRLLSNLQSLLAETGQTVVYITHDMDEAMSLADRLAVMLQGAIKQVGPPDQVFAAPVDHEVASFVGMETTVAGRIIESDDGQTVVKVGSQNLEAVGNFKKDQQVLFCIRPEDVTLWTGEQLPQSSARNHVSGKISFLRPHGHLVHVTVDCGFPVGALITRASAREMELSEGRQVSATFKASAVHLIPRE